PATPDRLAKKPVFCAFRRLTAAHFNLHLCPSGRVRTTPSGTISNAVLLPNEYGKFVPRGRGTRYEFLFRGSKSIMWEVVCPVHGSHRVDQKTPPTVCKMKVQLSPRCVRECRKRLASVAEI